MDKTWYAEGNWGDGSKFKQEITFKYGLDSTVVFTEAKGFADRQQTKYGDRNHGIRRFDVADGKLHFWEFDVFGGLTQGEVTFNDKNIIYTYNYQGAAVTDAWEYVNANTYNFKVGNWSDGKWNQIYLETQFKALNDGFDYHFDHQSLVVTNLIATGDFYRDVLKLAEIPDPNRALGLRRFQVRGNTQLHLVKKDGIEFKKDKDIHLCLSTQDLEGVIEHLMAKGVDFYDRSSSKGSVTVSSDGVQQIYLQDPDGYWVEINTGKH
ncbi:VOC family protein [uncultured Croceitalea sp.]|uniref:VOC family protein n=1 Tax=uncultured Croceitalea sp. TaxID=1798908 RepID=UPI0033058D38